MESNSNYKHIPYKDRKSVIEDTKNMSLIKKFFKARIDFSYENNNFIVNRDSVSSPQFQMTDKYGIFFSEKAGSTAIISTFRDYDLSKLELTNELTYRPYMLSKLNSGELVEVEKKFEPLESILTGTSTKDLIIVTRNPIYKFLSGLYQDITRELEHSNILLDIISSQFDIKYNHLDELDKIKSLPPKALYTVAYNLLNYRLNAGENVCSSHSKMYNEFYYLLLNNNKIDISKLKIIDLDDPNSDLIKCLGEYNPEIVNERNESSYWTHRSYHEILMKGIEKLCIENKNMALLYSIRDKIQNDFYYYTLMRKKYQDNIYKK